MNETPAPASARPRRRDWGRWFGRPGRSLTRRLIWLAAAWIVIQLMIGLASGSGIAEIGQIAVAAHIGGFLAGLAATRPLLRWRFRKKPHGVG